MAHPSMGRFAEPALWILVALRAGPAGAATIFDAVRSLDGPVGPATLFAALARLERRTLVERVSEDRQPKYRLTDYSREVAR